MPFLCALYVCAKEGRKGRGGGEQANGKDPFLVLDMLGKWGDKNLLLRRKKEREGGRNVYVYSSSSLSRKMYERNPFKDGGGKGERGINFFLFPRCNNHRGQESKQLFRREKEGGLGKQGRYSIREKGKK